MKKLIIFLVLFASVINVTYAQWQKINNVPGTGYKSMAVNGPGLYVGSQGIAIQRSIDNCASWTTLHNGLPSFLGYWDAPTSLAISGANIFVGTMDGIYLSDNNGLNFIAVNNGLPSADRRVNSIAINGSKVFAGIAKKGIYFSGNNGANWTPVNNGIPLNYEIISIAISGSNIFASAVSSNGGTHQGVYLSTNNGTSWTAVNNGLPANPYISALTVNGTNIYAGTMGGVYLSTNNGTSWTAVNAGIANTHIFSIAVSGPNIFAESGNDIFLSKNNGTSWISIKANLPLAPTSTWALYYGGLAVCGPNLYTVIDSSEIWMRPLSEMTDPICNASFTYTINNGTVTLTNTSAGNYPHTNWNFDDGTVSSDANPVHTFLHSGTYNICLSLSDSLNTINCTYCHHVYVDTSNTTNCNANFQFSISGNNVSFYGPPSSSSTQIYLWDFGDGGTSNLINPTHHYANPGIYNVCLKKTCSNVVSTVYCHNITIGNPPPPCNASFTAHKDSINSHIYYFHNTSVVSDSLSTFSWNFGDGTTSTLVNPVHHFQNFGTYNVCLHVLNNLGNIDCHYCNTVVVDSVINQDCQAYFQYTVNGNNVVFHAFSPSSSPAQTYSWNFGDGSTSDLINPTHHYNVAGTYNVCLTKTCSNGATDVYCQHITIGNPPACNASFSAHHDISNPYIYYFHNTSVISNTLSTYAWNFGDGTTSSEVNPTHTFLNSGTYNVCLNIINPYNNILCSYCDSVVVDTVNIPNCQANFQFSINGNNVAFYGAPSTSAAQIYSWDFGDGGHSDLINPVHHYTDPGTYNVCLTTTCAYGTTSVYCHNITILNPAACDASFYANQDSANSHIYYFYNTSVVSDSLPIYSWKFGDGATSNELNPVHTYMHPGTYHVCLHITNNLNNILCSYCSTVTVADTINTPECNAHFTYYIHSDGHTYQFVNMSQNSGNYLYYSHWVFGDGSYSNELNPTHVFTNPGTYHVCLNIATWTGTDTCFDSSCKDITVPDNNPDTLKFIVQGAVHADSVLATSAAVVLFNADLGYFNAVDYKIVTDGTFQFDDVLQGHYILWAVPNISNYPHYLPTYYGDVLHWQDAYIVNVNANTYGLDIHLLNIDSLLGHKLTDNTGSIEGTILFDNDLTYETDIFSQNWFEGKTGSVKNNIAGRNIPIFLEDSNGDIVSWTLADMDGKFNFSDLILQDYTVNAEKASLLSVSPIIPVTSSAPDVSNVMINIGTYSIVTSVNNQLSYEILNSLSYYPNPVKDNLTLDFTLVKQASVNISILNITGQEVNKFNYSLSEGSNKITMDLNALNSGIYFVRVNVENGNVTNFKIIK